MFTIAVENTIEISVKFTLRSKGADKTFSPTLTIRRLEDGEADPDLNVSEFLHQYTTGWSGQRLVLDEQGQPAEFSPEALKVFYGVPGVIEMVWAAYKRDIRIKEKN